MSGKVLAMREELKTVDDCTRIVRNYYLNEKDSYIHFEYDDKGNMTHAHMGKGGLEIEEDANDSGDKG